MRITPTLVVLALLVTGLAGCGIIYKPDIQQGSVLNTENVEQLKPGMTKTQVLALLGEPSIASPFDQNRWDYVSTLQKRGGKIDEKIFTVYFENDVLARTEGDYRPMDAAKMLQQVSRYPTIYHDKKKEAEARRRDGDGS